MNHKFEIIWLAPESLIPYVKNAKTHPPEQIDKIAGQIAAFGFDQPIVVDRSMVIIKGHGRREAALKLKLSAVPVIVSTLDEYQAMAARIADNKVAESPWDMDMLKFDIGTLDAQGFDLDLTGISNVDITNIINPETIEREEGIGIEDAAENHDETDIRQIILIMTQEDFDPMVESLLKIQDEQGLDNNTEVLKFLLALYENSKTKKTEI